MLHGLTGQLQYIDKTDHRQGQGVWFKQKDKFEDKDAKGHVKWSSRILKDKNLFEDNETTIRPQYKL